MTRRSVIRLLLSLLLLMSQQMALSHAVTHWSGRMAPAAAQQRAADGSLSGSVAQDQWCDQCLAFAQIAGTVGSAARGFAPPDAASNAVAASAGHARCARTVCVFLSRAPPAIA
jgi:hypothetical protein